MTPSVDARGLFVNVGRVSKSACSPPDPRPTPLSRTLAHAPARIWILLDFGKSSPKWSAKPLLTDSPDPQNRIRHQIPVGKISLAIKVYSGPRFSQSSKKPLSSALTQGSTELDILLLQGTTPVRLHTSPTRLVRSTRSSFFALPRLSILRLTYFSITNAMSTHFSSNLGSSPTWCLSFWISGSSLDVNISVRPLLTICDRYGRQSHQALRRSNVGRAKRVVDSLSDQMTSWDTPSYRSLFSALNDPHVLQANPCREVDPAERRDGFHFIQHNPNYCCHCLPGFFSHSSDQLGIRKLLTSCCPHRMTMWITYPQSPSLLHVQDNQARPHCVRNARRSKS